MADGCSRMNNDTQESSRHASRVTRHDFRYKFSEEYLLVKLGIKIINVLVGLYHFIIALVTFFIGFSYHKNGKLDLAVEKYKIAVEKKQKNTRLNTYPH